MMVLGVMVVVIDWDCLLRGLCFVCVALCSVLAWFDYGFWMLTVGLFSLLCCCLGLFNLVVCLLVVVVCALFMVSGLFCVAWVGYYCYCSVVIVLVGLYLLIHLRVVCLVVCFGDLTGLVLLGFDVPLWVAYGFTCGLD